MRRLIPILTFLIVVGCSTSRDITPEKLDAIVTSNYTPIQKDIYDAVKNIAKKHNIERGAVYQEMSVMLLDRPPLLFASGKGGVSPLGGGCYVINSKEKNIIITDAGEWTGGVGSIGQLVCVIGQKVIPIGEVKSGESPLFVWFLGDRIRYFDWKELSGGYVYRTETKESEPVTPLNGEAAPRHE